MTGTISGSVFYRERIAMPADATVRVRLVEVSQTAPLGELTIDAAEAEVPIPFELRYEPTEIDSQRSYAVEAEIYGGEELLFQTAKPVLVITNGHPVTDVGVLLHSVPQ